MPIQDLYAKPGYQIRRLRQIAAAIFVAEAAPYGVTSQQYTTLAALQDVASLEQNELCDLLRLDRSTMATLLVRLEEKELIRRSTSTLDRRRKHVVLTPRGRRLLAAIGPALKRIQENILAPLAPADRVNFARMLEELVEAHTIAADERSQKEEEAS
jgi:DNA-binding MarR family transcriptional regulator